MDLTPAARDFVERNAAARVVSGAWLPPAAMVGEDRRLVYRLEDGGECALAEADVVSLLRAGINVRWKG